MLAQNTLAPDFTLLDQAGEQHSLSDYQGEWVLLYFYPQDDTPGCTKEACSFRDNMPHFEDLDVQVIGISSDGVESHRKFVEKYGLNFTLLSDEQKKVISTYEAGGYVTKRISYLIDSEGRIYKAYAKVNPVTHVEDVKRDLEIAGVAT